ncbi:MAG: methyltransferase [Gemmatimonadales bacterium]|nr:methyltransferase [Gemmatimonadales bacterium]NIN73543.1 methyltransferase [Gemmatimonadota bacterium]NIQ99895.1 methyltransferase [Gemmatimonadales bacterium]
MSESAASTSSAETDPREALLQIVNGPMLSQCVYVAAKLGIADLLKDGPKSSEELAAATQVHARTLYRILRALAGLGVFAEDQERRFTLTPMAEQLCDVPGSARGWTILRGEEFIWQPFGQILHSVKTGESAFTHFFGMDGWEYLGKHPEASAIFDNAMRSISALKFGAVAEAYDFSAVDTIVDVGGGNGGLMTSILTSNPHLNGVLAELPHVVESARKKIDAAGLSDRCSCVAIDMFEAIPEGADAYIMANVIQGCDDDHAVRTLGNCRRAMKAGGRVLVVEMLIPGPNEPHLSKLADIEMLVMTDGGRERTKQEYQALYEAAGLRVTGVIPTNSPWSIVEGVAN